MAMGAPEIRRHADGRTTAEPVLTRFLGVELAGGGDRREGRTAQSPVAEAGLQSVTGSPCRHKLVWLCGLSTRSPG